jgi:hypothetical protein
MAAAAKPFECAETRNEKTRHTGGVQEIAETNSYCGSPARCSAKQRGGSMEKSLKSIPEIPLQSGNRRPDPLSDSGNPANPDADPAF